MNIQVWTPSALGLVVLYNEQSRNFSYRVVVELHFPCCNAPLWPEEEVFPACLTPERSGRAAGILWGF